MESRIAVAGWLDVSGRNGRVRENAATPTTPTIPIVPTTPPLPNPQLPPYRAPWFDPQTGRFVSEDPLGFGAGDANLNRYVGNDPLNKTDPSGLEEWPEKSDRDLRELYQIRYGAGGRILVPDLVMRCAVCHGSAYYGWYNVAAYGEPIEPTDQTLGILEGKRNSGPQAFAFQASKPSLLLAVGQSRQLHLIWQVTSELSL